MLFYLVACIDNNILPVVDEPPGPIEPTIVDASSDIQVLLLIDSSCSMADNTVINYGLAHIPLDLQASRATWQLGLGSAAPDDPWWFQTDNTASAPDWDLVLAMEDLQANSLDTEAGLEASTTTYDLHSDWFSTNRDTQTFIIMVSDEQDQSSIEPVDFVNFWSELEPIVISIVGIDQNTDGCTADYATRYIDVSDSILNICLNEPYSLFKTN